MDVILPVIYTWQVFRGLPSAEEHLLLKTENAAMQARCCACYACYTVARFCQAPLAVATPTLHCIDSASGKKGLGLEHHDAVRGVCQPMHSRILLICLDQQLVDCVYCQS